MENYENNLAKVGLAQTRLEKNLRKVHCKIPLQER